MTFSGVGSHSLEVMMMRATICSSGAILRRLVKGENTLLQWMVLMLPTSCKKMCEIIALLNDSFGHYICKYVLPSLQSPLSLSGDEWEGPLRSL